MNVNLDFYRSVQRTKATDTDTDYLKRCAKDNLTEMLVTSINYVDNAKRNGKSQRFVVTPTKTRYKYNIEAFPNEDLFVGDYIECLGHHWIVVETSVGSPTQTIGTMWLCNLELAWQNFSSDILRQWCVLDSGVYSTTKAGTDVIEYPDKQFKLYLPYNDDTQKMFVDKRLAVDTRYNSFGELILEVYKVTGLNRVARSYGNNGHLLILELRSDEYAKDKDNIEELICDYISPDEETSSSDYVCNIVGRNSIPKGTTRKYQAKFYAYGKEVSAIAVWNVYSSSMDLIDVRQEENTLIITVDENYDIDNDIVIDLADTTGTYTADSMTVEVTD